MPGMSQPKINSYCRDFLALQNLIHLELCFYDIGDVFKVLQNCPKLQILSIIKVNFLCLWILCSFFWFLCVCFINLILVYIMQWSYLHNQDLHRNWKNPNLVPKCISSHLRSCTLRYIGYVDEIHFATYILKNAPLLQVMKIIVVKPSSSCQNALKELESRSRISPKCELSIRFW
jgi:hypothetical protein